MDRLFIVILLLPFVFGCTKEIELEETGDEPIIEYVSVSPTEVENFDNSITLSIRYTDKNGDIGFSDPDQYALWVKDSRLDSADWYHIPPLSPPGYDLIINGQLDIVLNSMFILGNGNQELVTLAVKLRDRANHWSNIIYTPAITVKKP